MRNHRPERPVATGERFTFTHTAASTGGELLAFDLALSPGGAVPIAHVHPMPRNLLDLAVLARKYDQEAHASLLTVEMQRVLLAPRVFFARRPLAGPEPLLAS